MLEKFEVENFRKFDSRLEFDFNASNYDFNNSCTNNGLITTAIVYGKNGSGKTCLGYAIQDLVSHLTDTSSAKLITPYYLNASSKQTTVNFVYHFLFFGSSVVYKYSKNESQKIVSEKLFIDNKLVIDYELSQPIKTSLLGAEGLAKDIPISLNLSALKYIEKNAKLSERSKYTKIFKELMSFVSKMLFFRSLFDAVEYVGYSNGSFNVASDVLEKNNLSDFQNFLNESEIAYELVEISNNGRRDIGVKFEDKILPFWGIASTGTKNLMMFYYWWRSLRDGEVSFVFIDEFDSSYHYEVSQSIVKRLRDLLSTQVILTTHNTALLSNDLIRPDCAYHLENGRINSLPHLTDKELRFGHNLERLFRAKAFNNV